MAAFDDDYKTPGDFEPSAPPLDALALDNEPSNVPPPPYSCPPPPEGYPGIWRPGSTPPTTSSLPVPADARSMAVGNPEPVPQELTEEQQRLNSLANNILKSASTLEEQKLAMSIFTYINSGNDSKLDIDQQQLKNWAKDLLNLELTPEQLEIATHVFSCLADGEGIDGVIDLCAKYFVSHRKPVLFGKGVYEIIKQIHRLSEEVYNKELKSAFSTSGAKQEILTFDDEFVDPSLGASSDIPASAAAATTTTSSNSPPLSGDTEGMPSGAPEYDTLSPSNPQGVIDFYNMPGKDHYLFIRMLERPFFEADILLGKAKGPIRYWMSATAIENGVPIKPIFIINTPIGFLYKPIISVGQTTDGKVAWGKTNLNSCIYKGLDKDGKITVVRDPKAGSIEKNPIGEKLEEMRQRVAGEIPDKTTKGKLKSKYRGRNKLNFNEVLVHPEIEGMLGIIIDLSRAWKIKNLDKYKIEAQEVQKYIEDNGGPHFPIFMYTPGNLTRIEK